MIEEGKIKATKITSTKSINADGNLKVRQNTKWGDDIEEQKGEEERRGIKIQGTQKRQQQ